jgi:hypothetical protein
MSKNSTLSDAIDQINKLQSQVLKLQRQLDDSTAKSRKKQAYPVEEDVKAQNTNTNKA